MRNICRRQ